MSLSGSLENSDAKSVDQNGNVSSCAGAADLEKRLASMQFAVDTANQRITTLSETNKVMSEVIDTRKKKYRDYWPIAFGILTFAIAANVGYQVFKSDEVRRTAASIQRERALQSNVAGNLTQTIVLLSLGYRDDARGRPGSAFRRSEKALAILKPWKSYVDAKKHPEQAKAFTDAQTETFLAVDALLPAVEEALIASYELQGRACFRLMDYDDQYIEKTRAVGENLTKLDPSIWTGPHFIGLAKDTLAERQKDPAMRATLRAEAEVLYLQAKKNDPTEGALDLLNLAESKFLDGMFEKASGYASQYKALDDLAPPEHLTAMDFLVRASEYAKTGSEADLGKTFQAVLEISKMRFLNYSWSSYKDLLKKPKQGFRKWSFARPETRTLLLLCISAATEAASGRNEFALIKAYPRLEKARASLTNNPRR